VATAAHRDEQIVAAGELDGGDDIGHAGTAGDETRPSVDHAIPDLAGLLVAVLTGVQQVTAQAGPEGFHNALAEDRFRAAVHGDLQVCHHTSPFGEWHCLVTVVVPCGVSSVRVLLHTWPWHPLRQWGIEPTHPQLFQAPWLTVDEKGIFHTCEGAVIRALSDCLLDWHQQWLTLVMHLERQNLEGRSRAAVTTGMMHVRQFVKHLPGLVRDWRFALLLQNDVPFQHIDKLVRMVEVLPRIRAGRKLYDPGVSFFASNRCHVRMHQGSPLDLCLRVQKANSVGTHEHPNA
jgi:hypothetical protein